MAALARLRRIQGVIRMTVRQSGNSRGASACAVTVSSRLPDKFAIRAPFVSVYSSRWFSNGDAKPKVDYSRVVPVIREGGKAASYNAVWLRDNCRCDACFLPTTQQRVVSYHRLPPEAFVASHVTWSSEEGVIDVTWVDGHLSRYR